MKILIEMLWFVVLIVSGYLAVQIGLHVADSHGVFLSGLAGIVAFIISVAILASLVWFVTDRIMPKDSAGKFSSDDEGARYDSDNGTVSFLWDDLVKIEINTNDKGPLEEDVFWCFFDGSNDEKVIIPQGLKKDKSIIKAVKRRFHSSNDLKMDLAIGCCQNKRHIIWQAMDFEEGPIASERHLNQAIEVVNKGREVSQNNWVTFFIVLLALACYGGYFLFNKFNPDSTLWDGVYQSSIELFGLSLIGIMGIYLYSASELKRFQRAYPSIDSEQAVEALKPVVKRCMWLALFAIVFIALSFGLLAMVADVHGGKSGMIAGVVLTAVSLVFSQWYDPQEKAFKQMPCTDEQLERKLQVILNSWEKDLLPKF